MRVFVRVVCVGVVLLFDTLEPLSTIAIALHTSITGMDLAAGLISRICCANHNTLIDLFIKVT